MTLGQIASILFEPRETRYVGRHRAAERIIAVVRAPLGAGPIRAEAASAVE